jgi:protein-S-isoprenylcysteine O-methyltransferase Ste14
MSSITKIQLLYLLAFTAQHSLLASRRFKDLVWSIFGPGMERWYMSFFGILAAIAIAPLVILFLISPGRKLYSIHGLGRKMMIAGQLLAGAATILAFINAPHRFSISQQLGKAVDADRLLPRGIYCLVRDPFLLGGLAQMWLTPFMTTNLLILYVITSVYLFLGSMHWESRLRFQFGKEYEDYQKSMPRLFPQLRVAAGIFGTRDVENIKCKS